MPFSRRRNRGRLTVRQLVAGGWWLVAGSAYGADRRHQPPAAPLSFRPQRSGVEKSHCSMVQAALRWEISRLRATIEL